MALHFAARAATVLQDVCAIGARNVPGVGRWNRIVPPSRRRHRGPQEPAEYDRLPATIGKVHERLTTQGMPVQDIRLAAVGSVELHVYPDKALISGGTFEDFSRKTPQRLREKRGII